MSRFAAAGRVLFIEEPIHGAASTRLEVAEVLPNLWVCTPHFGAEVTAESSEAVQRRMIHELLREREFVRPILWFYTPMALPLAVGLEPSLVIYDCMDELSGFRGAPTQLQERERELFGAAHLVFTGGQSLYESKRLHHPAVYAFPSSVDANHFSLARRLPIEPADQRNIPANRVGFFGVLDERMDLDLLAALAAARPSYQIVMIGPVVKIAQSDLPHAANIHYLGPKDYLALPSYLAGWQVAIMPFALNEATRFISPTKTLEYLAAGKPVVSTAVRDVVIPYGELGLVSISDSAHFPEAVDAALSTEMSSHLRACDELLARTSWDDTWSRMQALIAASLEKDVRALMREEKNNPCSTI
jgi:UDP-galactopyranose mutase